MTTTFVVVPCIVAVYILVAYIAMAYIVMAYAVTAYVAFMAYGIHSHGLYRYGLCSYDHRDWACIVMALIFMAYRGRAYILRSYGPYGYGLCMQHTHARRSICINSPRDRKGQRSNQQPRHTVGIMTQIYTQIEDPQDI